MDICEGKYAKGIVLARNMENYREKDISVPQRKIRSINEQI